MTRNSKGKMMKANLLIAVLLTFALLATACAPAPGGIPSEVEAQIIPDIDDTATPPAVVATVILVPTATRPVTATATESASPDMILTINTQGELAPFLADRQGRSLYIFLDDFQHSNASTCIDDCAVEWPPLIVTGTPDAGEGVDASLLETVTRDDGSIQATYNGWPLHYYIMDTIPGTTHGQRLKGVWFLLSPSGEPIQR
jgi:predicted lipoprotein with Yx(FWY)xxD motif